MTSTWQQLKGGIKLIEIQTTTLAEFKKISKLLLGQKLDVSVRQPIHCMASTCWSVADVIDKFPENTPIELMIKGLKKIERPILEAMVMAGYDVINNSKDELLSVLPQDILKEYKKSQEEMEEE